MISFEGRNLYSPRDLLEYLECPYLTVQRLRGAVPEAAERDEFSELLFERGLDHEKGYLAHLGRSGGDVVEISPDLPLHRRVAVTREAMRSGTPVIYQGVLMEERWHGHCDFLVRVEKPSALGGFSYEVVDTKLSRSPKASHVVQIGVYSWLLACEQQAEPALMHLVLGTGEKASLRFKRYRHYCSRLMAVFEAFCAEPPSDLYPDKVEHCTVCELRRQCAERREADDHLSLVADIRTSQIRKLQKAGILTVADLASAPATRHVPKLAPESFRKIRLQARLQVKGRTEGRACFEILPAQEGRGFHRLPKPTEGDLFFDMEGDPLYPDGLEYLFGLCVQKGDRWTYRSFWAHSHEEEERAVEGLMACFGRHLERYPEAHIYHYNHYEVTALKRLTSRCGVCEAALDDLLRKRKFVDLYRVVRETVRTSQPGYSLKDLEVFYMEKRGDSVTTSGESVVAYEQWRQTGRGELLEQIRAYNETDCMSLIGLRSWLLGLKPRDIPWPEPPRAENGEAGTKWSEAEEERSRYERLLTEGFSGEEFRVRRLAADLLEFHRREAKPQWWAMFDRQQRSDEELMDDIECLGGLQMDPRHSPEPDKRSLIFTYIYPEQETKLTVGRECLCAATLEPAGTIHEMDDTKHSVRVRRAAGYGPLPRALSLIPAGPINTTVMKKALYRLADSIIEGDQRFRAVWSLLMREPPRLRGCAPGEAVVVGEPPGFSEIKRAVMSLDESTLFIQGPPGSGKTHVASHLIVDLIQAGNRVGVMSNSHKAINNLLARVESLAKERAVTFRGIKKSTAGQEDSFLDGEIIEDVTDNQSVDPGADLIAGTVWLFSREELDGALDYLFIDEAGQVALANVAAAGLSARNIVLVGDQMQLGQPLQGVHPRESGQSVLDYLLQGQATVAPEFGVFLATTRRMHEGLSSFISQAVYDGRLHAAEENRNQRLVLGNTAHPALIPAGLRFVEVDHQGCGQRSEEEGEVVRAVYMSLLQQRHRDRNGRESPIGVENIIVVAPYNLQVNHLRSILPPGARVGTIDKFQGQEAEVSIISMTTSSGEELSRQIGFLYSRNRLNVAVSRARTLAVIVASPRLLEIKCRNIEEMELVNTLCWAREYSNAWSTDP